MNRGWGLAKVTLGNERVSIIGGSLWGMGPTRRGPARPRAPARGGTTDPVLRQRLAGSHRARAPAPDPPAHRHGPHQGRAPGAEASIRKILADEHGQAIMGLAKDLAGAGGMLAEQRAHRRYPSGMWPYGFLFALRSRSAAAPARCSATSSPSDVLGPAPRPLTAVPVGWGCMGCLYRARRLALRSGGGLSRSDPWGRGGACGRSTAAGPGSGGGGRARASPTWTRTEPDH